MNKGNRAAKKAFALLLSLVMVICMMPQMAFADIADEEPGPQVVTEDGFTIEDGVLTAYSGTDTEVTVPDGVVTIGNGTDAVFGKGSNVTKVTMPDSVTAIAAKAFFQNTELLTVVFSDNLTTIGKNAFQSCEKLENVSFPESLKSIEQNAFQTCKGLTEIVFPENLETLGAGAFIGCSGLKGTLEIPEKVTSIGNNTFNSAIFEKVILRSGNTTISTLLDPFKAGTLIYYYEGNTGAAAYCQKKSHPSVIMYPIAAGGKYMVDLQSFFGEGDLTYTVSVDDGPAETLEGSIYQTPAPAEGQTKDLLFTASDDRTHHIFLEGRTYQDFVIEEGVLKAYNGSASSVEIPYGVTIIGDGSGPVFGCLLYTSRCV